VGLLSRAGWGDVGSGDNLFGLLGYFVGAARGPSRAICGRKTLTREMEVVAVRGVRGAGAAACSFVGKPLKLHGYFRFLDATDLVP
jgi:hypothetical protein